MPTSRNEEGVAERRHRKPFDGCCDTRCEDCGLTCADFDEDEDGWWHLGQARCGCVLCDTCTIHHDIGESRAHGQTAANSH